MNSPCARETISFIAPLAPTRILLLRIGAMGDILHALPAVAALRAALPHAHIAWAVEPHWSPLLSPALVNHVHPVPTRAWKQRPFTPQTLREILHLRRDLRAARYDIAVDLQGSIRSAMIARLSAAPRILGPATPREAPAARLYRECIPTHTPSVITRAAELLSAAIRQPLIPQPAILPHDPAAESWADSLSLPPRFTLLLPGAGWAAKQWPLASFAALTRALIAAGHPVVVNATSADLTSLQHAGARLVPSTIPQLIALTRRAALAIGGDTGPTHLAAALGRPTVALFGPTDPARNGPHFPLPTPSSVPHPSRSDERVHLNDRICIILRHPASSTSYRHTSTPDPGLAAITVEEVLTAARSLLEPQ